MKTKNLFYLCVVSFTLAFFIYCLFLPTPPTVLSEMWDYPEDVQAMPDWLPSPGNNLVYKTQRYNFFEAWPSQDGIPNLYSPWKTPTLSYEPVWAQGSGYLGSNAYPLGGGGQNIIDINTIIDIDIGSIWGRGQSIIDINHMGGTQYPLNHGVTYPTHTGHLTDTFTAQVSQPGLNAFTYMPGVTNQWGQQPGLNAFTYTNQWGQQPGLNTSTLAYCSANQWTQQPWSVGNLMDTLFTCNRTEPKEIPYYSGPSNGWRGSTLGVCGQIGMYVQEPTQSPAN